VEKGINKIINAVGARSTASVSISLSSAVKATIKKRAEWPDLEVGRLNFLSCRPACGSLRQQVEA
jgi:hypothetical protein